jgi:REP element-mobilizing transposase RayT
MPSLTPLYTASNCKPAYRLYWSLTIFWKQPGLDADSWFPTLKDAVEPDGVRLLGHRFKTPEVSQFLLSTKPHVAPPNAIRSVKGRLQHIVRQQLPRAFQRNYALHSVGAASRAVVEDYIHSQLEHHPLADKRAEAMLRSYQVQHRGLDLSKPRSSSHGQFSHNLHLVFVHQGRWREIREEVLGAVHAMVLRASRARGHLLGNVGILPDHLHLEIGCGLEESPLEVALGYLNNLAYAQGMKPVYQYGFYVGTFGEYDLGAIRRYLPEES